MKPPKTKWIRDIFFAFSLLIFSTPAGFAARAIPEDYVRYPVLVTLDSGASASGFYLNNEKGDAYFVTAKHIFFTDKAQNAGGGSPVLRGTKALLLSYPQETQYHHPMYIELELAVLLEKGSIKTDESIDIVAVKVGFVSQIGSVKSLQFVEGAVQKAESTEEFEGTLLGASSEVIKKYDDVSIGNEVFIFGYPVSLGIENYAQIDYRKPLLRRGAIAGKNDDKKTIILDCPTVYGNSGGPVFEVEQISLTQTQFWIIGVVSEFIPFQDKWYQTKQPFRSSPIENSGYSVVIPMDTILDLIES